MARRKAGVKPHIKTGLGFEGGEVKVICLETLIKKLKVSRVQSPVNFSTNEQDKILAACEKSMGQGNRFIKVRIKSGETIEGTTGSKKLLVFELIEDGLSLPEKIRALCADVFKELAEVGLEMAPA